jgi:hypothetical protein
MEERKSTTEGTMTSREMVLAALEHRQPDKAPRDFGGTTATGINIVACKDLVDYLGLEDEVIFFSEWVRLADISKTLLERFKSDTRVVMPGGAYRVGDRREDGTSVDGYGVVRALSDENGHWYVMELPLSVSIPKSDIEAAAKKWPDPTNLIFTEEVGER